MDEVGWQSERYRQHVWEEVKAAGEEKYLPHEKALRLATRFLGWYSTARSKLCEKNHPESLMNARSLYMAAKVCAQEFEPTEENGHETSLLERLHIPIEFNACESRLTRSLIRDYLGKLRYSAPTKNTGLYRSFLESVANEALAEGSKVEYSPLREEIKEIELGGLCFLGFDEKRKKTPTESVSLDEVGGNAEAKQEIRYLIQAFQNREKQERWGYRFPKGILFYGPPGTGKTLLAKVLAEQTGLDFVEVYLTDFLSKWVGESEKRLERMLSGTNRIFFLDELDSIGRDKHFLQSEVGVNLTNTLAIKMNEITAQHFSVYVGATNEVESIDKKLRSPHRFSRIIPFHYPGPTELEEIALIHTRKRLKRMKDVQEMKWEEEEVWVKALIAKSETLAQVGKPRLVGADVEEIVERSFESRFRVDLDQDRFHLPSPQDFLDVIKGYDSSRTEVGVGR